MSDQIILISNRQRVTCAVGECRIVIGEIRKRDSLDYFEELQIMAALHSRPAHKCEPRVRIENISGAATV